MVIGCGPVSGHPSGFWQLHRPGTSIQIPAEAGTQTQAWSPAAAQVVTMTPGSHVGNPD